MMRWVTSSSVRLAGLVVAIAVGVAPLGRVDTYPEFPPPMVQIRTEALGLSETQVEQLITVPLEQDLLNEVPRLDQIRSQSLTRDPAPLSGRVPGRADQPRHDPAC